MCVHTVCVCVCLEQWHLNVSCMSLISEILRQWNYTISQTVWVPKMFYSQMYIKFISKTTQADKYLHAIFQI